MTPRSPTLPSVPPPATGVDRPATLDDLLDVRAADRPDATALILPRPVLGALEHLLGDRAWTTTTFGDLARRVEHTAAGLRAAGIGPGTRVALLVPPTADFFVVAHALVRVRAVPVVVDPGIGTGRVRDCLAQAEPDAFVGVPRAHLARRLFGWCPGARIAVSTGPAPVPGTLSLRRLERLGAARVATTTATTAHAARPAGDPAAVLFTSGSTGPPKGVEHTDEGLLAQAALIRELYGLGPGEVSLATFPPFALFGPALGMTTVVPRMDPTRPGRVRAARLVRAVRHHGATVMFGSPAVLDRLGRGAPRATVLPTLRQVVSAGAPVARDVQRRVLALLPRGAQVHTPYGATEALPVASIGSDELLDLPDDGICVGRPVPGVAVTLIRSVDAPLEAVTPDLEVGRGEVGEVVVRGPVVSRGYVARPDATAAAGIDWQGHRAHRTGDLASWDADGRLWFAGRVAHVVTTAGGPLYSVPCEEVLNRDPAVRRSALVGVGAGPEQTPVFVVELADRTRWNGALRARLRAHLAADPRTRDVETLVRHPRLPVDPRHNSKIDRPLLAVWAAGRLRAPQRTETS